ncbi:MAG TPA: hypothetical protein VJ011_04355 [Steroidobacteraceae bacterium]|nr:hypothetical protein [Steroidobacteraceae bacterium]
MKTFLVAMAVALVAALPVACTSQKEPAARAIEGLETGLVNVRRDAAEYAPDALQAFETQLAAVKEDFAKGEYEAVLAAVPRLTAAVDALKGQIAAGKLQAEAATARATEAWNGYSNELPKMLQAIQGRVDSLGKLRRLPKELDAATFESAKAGLEATKAAWAEATGAAASGNVVDAAARAQAAKDQGSAVMQQLGMA